MTKKSKFYLHEGETLLEGLVRTGHDINYQCKEGYCGSCRVRVIRQSEPTIYRCQTLAMIDGDEILSCCCDLYGVIHIDI